MKCKEKIALDVCDIYPFLEEYRRRRHNVDFDGFDAAGILAGWERHSTAPNGLPRICGMCEKRHKSLVFYNVQSIESLKGNIDGIYTPLGVYGFNFNPTILMFHTDYDKISNIRIATTNNDFVITFLPQKYYNEVKWQFDLNITDKDMVVMYIVRKSKFTKSEIEFLKEAMVWEEI